MQDFPGADPVPDFATSPGTDDSGDGTGTSPRLSVTWDRQSSLASSPSCSDAESSEFDYGGHPPQSEIEEIPSPLWLSPLRPRWPPIHQPQSLEIRREVKLSGIMRTLVANMLKKMEKGNKRNEINIAKHNSEATVDAGIPKMSRAIFDNVGYLTMLSFHQPKMKMILKLDLHDDKAMQKAIKAVVTLSGIDSMAVHMEDKKMMVVGVADPEYIVGKLRKLHGVPLHRPRQVAQERGGQEGGAQEGRQERGEKVGQRDARQVLGYVARLRRLHHRGGTQEGERQERGEKEGGQRNALQVLGYVTRLRRLQLRGEDPNACSIMQVFPNTPWQKPLKNNRGGEGRWRHSVYRGIGGGLVPSNILVRVMYREEQITKSVGWIAVSYFCRNLAAVLARVLIYFQSYFITVYIYIYIHDVHDKCKD